VRASRDPAAHWVLRLGTPLDALAAVLVPYANAADADDTAGCAALREHREERRAMMDAHEAVTCMRVLSIRLTPAGAFRRAADVARWVASHVSPGGRDRVVECLAALVGEEAAREHAAAAFRDKRHPPGRKGPRAEAVAHRMFDVVPPGGGPWRREEAGEWRALAESLASYVLTPALLAGAGAPGPGPRAGILDPSLPGVGGGLWEVGGRGAADWARPLTHPGQCPPLPSNLPPRHVLVAGGRAGRGAAGAEAVLDPEPVAGQFAEHSSDGETEPPRGGRGAGGAGGDARAWAAGQLRAEPILTVARNASRADRFAGPGGVGGRDPRAAFLEEAGHRLGLTRVPWDEQLGLFPTRFADEARVLGRDTVLSPYTSLVLTEHEWSQVIVLSQLLKCLEHKGEVDALCDGQPDLRAVFDLQQTIARHKDDLDFAFNGYGYTLADGGRNLECSAAPYCALASCCNDPTVSSEWAAGKGIPGRRGEHLGPSA